MAAYTSWGRLSARADTILRPTKGKDAFVPATPYLAYGNGRSYGDSCFPARGALVDMRGLAQVLAFDAVTGVVKAEAGLLLGDLLPLIIPQGWFLPVTPGTRFVTLGGALANDVHGKNHHRAGTFGRHVRAFELLRSDGSRHHCSPAENPGLFRATIGGMGLTGIVSWVELQLMRVGSPDLRQETVPFGSLAEFFDLAAQSDERFDYVVAWVDSGARGAKLGRGLLMRANHADAGEAARSRAARPLPFPLDPPFPLLNGFTLGVFNALYRNLPRPKGSTLAPWSSFFYPLDRIDGWNRAYGPKGLRQFQCVVPHADGEAAVGEMLQRSQRAGHASFLTVLKTFGSLPSPGLLSFPRAGVTLTLDFPYRGEPTDRLLGELDAVTLAAGGAVNPYKDARMPDVVFRASFPNWKELVPFLDPMAASPFSERVGLTRLGGLP